ncbi:MAG: hypothetical protein ACYDBJ_25120 [Aggregatilineales bacterium]
MYTKKVVAIGLLMVVVLTVASAASPRQIVRADEAATKFTIVMDEYHFTVLGQPPDAPITLRTGTLYDMTIQNTGKFPHEIWWGKDPQMVEAEGRLDGYKINLLDKVPVAIIGVQADGTSSYEIDAPGLDEIEEAPGQSFTIAFTLPDSAKGKWEIGCFQPMPKPADAATADSAATAIPDVPHYVVGMKADLLIQ